VQSIFRMYKNKNIKVVIPAFNEEKSIGLVLQHIPKNLITEIVVANNNSKDNTSAVAASNGATVVFAPLPGYGNACLKALEHIRVNGGCDIVVFIDADYSDYPEEMESLLQPIIEKNMDMVIGSRALGVREKGSMTPQQLFGNKLSVFLIKIIFRKTFTDLGPFRAITWSALEKLQMQDKNYGWTVEMQVKAIKQKLTFVEVPVSYRNRTGGVSKVSGSLKGSILAGFKIIKTIFKYA
jgi:glycosyltransferase involved in cell wall biosynthesis